MMGAMVTCLYLTTRHIDLRKTCKFIVQPLKNNNNDDNNNRGRKKKKVFFFP